MLNYEKQVLKVFCPTKTHVTLQHSAFYSLLHGTNKAFLSFIVTITAYMLALKLLCLMINLYTVNLWKYNHTLVTYANSMLVNYSSSFK